MSSSIAELIAAYSPPMPAPVKADREHQERAGEGGRDGRDDVQRESDEEQLLAPHPVGEPAEEERPEARARDVDRGGQADLAVGDLQARPLLGQARGDRADDRDLEAVEDPHGAQPNEDHPVPAGPRKAVEPRGNPRLDDLALGHRLRRHLSSARWGATLRSPGCRSGKRPDLEAVR
jgi:hypothetical protein